MLSEKEEKELLEIEEKIINLMKSGNNNEDLNSKRTQLLAKKYSIKTNKNEKQIN